MTETKPSVVKSFVSPHIVYIIMHQLSVVEHATTRKGVIVLKRFSMSAALVSAIYAGGFGTSTLAQSAGADIPEMPASCELLDSNNFVRTVVCTDADYSHQDLMTAGRAACEDALPCGAWIWRDAANAPEAAPEAHDGLSQEQVTSAAGIWVAEQGNFIVIEQVQN